MNKIKQNSAITLIALVITIIVLLILAGLTLTFVIGENGLFGKARNVKEEHSKATASETLTLKITECQMKSYAENGKLPDLQYIADRFCDDNDIEYVHLQKKSTSAINEKIELGSNTSIYTKLEKYPYEFEINSSLQLASIDGVQVASTEPSDGYVKQSDYNALLARVEALENNSRQNITVVDAWSNSGSTNPNSITLSQNIDDYDFILIEGDDGSNYISSQLYKISNILFGDSKIGVYNDSYYVWYTTSSSNKNCLTYNDNEQEIIKKITLIDIN